MYTETNIKLTDQKIQNAHINIIYYYIGNSNIKCIICFRIAWEYNCAVKILKLN